ncbi:alpha/beta hydrolase [Mucilaginibacter sp. RCC_168]|uniref:alpha/beta hydrolase n=1 Tax=Mucilaginibacter sp. RCC_168 TaxID=3239221 RepID=UPI003525C805
MKKAILLIIFVLFIGNAYGQGQVIALYEKDIPNSKKAPASFMELRDSSGLISNVTHPNLTGYFPEKNRATGVAVIICPGGGYSVLAVDGCVEVAREFNKIGVAAFVLKYRLPNDTIMVDKSIGPLQDAQKAIMTVRQRAAEWGIDPHKIGLMGISAGGHLASTAGTHFDKPVIKNKGQISLRPDFMMLIYPVIVFDLSIASGTRESLIGKTAPAATLNFFSNDKHVTGNTPPTFLVHAADDDVVPVKNSLLFFNALLNAKVPAEMHIFQAGGHGFGLENPKSKNKWFDWCRNWLDENGFLKAVAEIAR